MGRSTASAPENSTFARVVSKWELLGTYLPWPAEDGEEDPLGGASLVGGDDVLEAGQFADLVVEAVEASRAGVRLVAAHDARPLIGAHGRRAAVGQQVDQHVFGGHQEEIVAASPQDLLAIVRSW